MCVTSASDLEAIFDDEQRDLEKFKADVKLVAWACETLWHDQFRRNSQDDNEFLSLLPVAVLRMVSARADLLSKPDSEEG